MLRKLKIGTRLNVLIAVPLIALIALANVSFIALQRASVRGDEYQQLKVAEDLRTDLVPPRANLLAAWASTAKIGVLVASPVTTRTNAEIQSELKKLDEARSAYFSAIDEWRNEPLQEAQQEALRRGAASGEAFFVKVDSLLLSAMELRDPATVLAAVREIEYDYNIQQIYIDQSLELVEAEVGAREASTDQFVSRVQWVIMAAVAALLVVLLIVAFFVRRSIVRPILALSSHARRAATTDLPEAVRQIQSLPADAPKPAIDMFQTTTSDELADLTDSFNSVQSAALDLASEQAVARRVVSENLINIARRTQSLLGRSLASLSDMEASERDPATLDKLFRLDHLATRMRRNAQSLLVLADAEQNRLWSAPLPIGDVVRAALSEIEHYTRVDLGDLGDQEGVLVQGALAADVAHLLAELLENSTSFSSPNTRVMVVGRAVGGGHQLAIIDYGIGMSDEALEAANDSLRRKSDFSGESSKVLGLQVVARIAARLGIQVALANTAGATGVTAIIRLPSEVFDSRVVPPVTARNGARQLPPPSAGQPALDFHEPLRPSELAVPAAPPATGTARPGSLPPAPVVAPAAGTATTTAVEAEAVRSISPLTPPSLTTLDVTPLPVTQGLNALPKRVRGAQLPDLGSDSVGESSGWQRPADEVRSNLTSLQRGTDLARQHRNDDQPTR